MALKQNMIELVKEVKDGEVIMEKYFTPYFIPLSVTYQAINLHREWSKVNADNELEFIQKLVGFIAKEIYDNQFTKEQIEKGLHAPSAIDVLLEQLMFVTRGHQNDETKKFLAKKR